MATAIVKKIITADILEGLALVKDTQIETLINGLEVTIRCHVIDGKVMFTNCFLNHTSTVKGGKVIGKLIRLLHD